MELKITSEHILKILQILSWIIFIGLCIEAGGIMVNTGITLFFNPRGVENFWQEKEYLSNLHKLNTGYFTVVTLIMIITSILKAVMFYLIVKIFTEKKLNLSHPFSSELKHFILMLSYISAGIGFFSYYGRNYTIWLEGRGGGTPDLENLNMEGCSIWIFMAVVLFIIGHIVKRGVEIQKENDLTV